MEEIKITRVNEEKYSDIRWYLDTIIPYVNFLSDLCFVEYQGTRYMITRRENEFIIVAHEGNELNPYVIAFDEEGHITKFSTEEFDYDLSLDFGEGVYGVKRESRLSKVCEQLVYFPKDDELDVTSIDFYQMYQEPGVGCILSYELPDTMHDVNYGLNYSSYHEPSKIVLLELKKILGLIAHVDHNIFYKQSSTDMYRKKLITINNLLIPTPFLGYDPNTLMEEIGKSGYKTKIPDDLKDMIRGTSPVVKRLEKVSSSYDSFTKGA